MIDRRSLSLLLVTFFASTLPAAGQILLELLDADGQPATSYLEGTRLYARVTDPQADTLSGYAETVGATASADVSGDSDMYFLWGAETGPATGVFEGSIELGYAPITLDDGTLQTARESVPPFGFDAVRITYGGSSVSVPVRPPAVEWTDASGAPADAYAETRPVYVRVEDQAANDPLVLDVVEASLQVPATGDDEALQLVETSVVSGVFEGSMATEAIAGPGTPVDGILQVTTGMPIEAHYFETFGDGESIDQADVVGAAVEVIDAGGLPVSEVLESGRLHVRVIDVAANADPLTAETAGIEITTLYSGDLEHLVLTETAADSAVFEGSLDSARLTTGGIDGLLETSDGGAPDYDPEVVTVLYGPYSDSVRVVGSRVSFINLRGQVVRTYGVRSTIGVRVEDSNAGTPGTVDTLQVTLDAPSREDSRVLTLTETAAASGVFEGSIDSSEDGGFADIWAEANHYLFVSHPNANNPLQPTARAVILPDWAPAAADDVETTPMDVAVAVNVLYNDFDADSDPLAVVAVTQGANGTTAINPDHTVTYTPDPGFFGTDSFTYVVVDPDDSESSATVDMTIDYVNQPPDAVDDTATMTSDLSPLNIDVLANDTDPEDDPLTIVSFTQGTNGSVSLEFNTLDYFPDPDFYGVDTFTYTIDDGNGSTDTATVTVTVDPPPDIPIVRDDTAAVDEDGSLVIDVLANDFDPEGEPLTVTVDEPPGNATAVVNPDNTVTFTPDPDWNGVSSFGYVAEDTTGHSAPATVTVTVNPVDDPPDAADDAVAVDEDASVVVNVLVNDSDPDGDPLDVTGVTQGTSGGVTLNPDDTVTYTPDPDFNGSDSFTYTIDDGSGLTDTATVSVTVSPVNDAPVAADDSAAVDEDDTVIVTVLANDSDPESDPLDVTGVTQGANGAVTLNPDDTVTYAPDPDFSGGDSFTYTIDDGGGLTDTATVSVTVNPVNDAPDAVDDAAAVDEDDTVIVTVLANDSDPESDPLDVTGVTQGTNGAVTLNPDDTVTYTPDPDFNGSDSFTYTIDDGGGLTDTATVSVTVNPVNDAPVAVDDGAGVEEDASVIVTVLGNDSDPESDPLDVVSVTQGASGTATLNPDDTVTYTPNPDFHGADAFTYTLSDGSLTDTATVSVTVNPVNDAPVAADDAAATAEDTPVVVAVLANDVDVDLDTLSVSSVTQGANGSVAVNPDQTLTYTPALNTFGADAFTYTAADGAGGESTATVTVNVSPVNDPPTAVDDTASTSSGTPVVVDVLANDSDVEGAALTVSSVTQGANGSVVVNGDDTVTYTADPAFAGTDAFTYTAADGAGGESTATVTVDVLGVATFTSVGAEDGWLQESNENSDVGGKTNAGSTNSSALRPGDERKDRQYKAIVSFDTSSLPDGATILSATLRLRRGTVSGTNPFTTHGQCRVDVNTGGFGGSTALEDSDFQAAATAPGAVILSNAPADLDWSEGLLDAAGLAAIHTSGTTQMRIAFDLDDNDDRGNDYIGYYSGDNNDASRHPQLVVTYQP